MAKNIKEIKKKYRRDLMQDIASLSSCYKNESDMKMISKLLETKEYIAAQTIFCYVGVGDEIDTIKFIKKAIDDNKTVCVPKCLDNERLQAKLIHDIDADLERGFYNLLEPLDSCEEIAPHEIDLIIVPCLSCDKKGNRIGRGSGYYDRFLLKTDAKTIILCRKEILRDDIPLEPHDIPVDMVISD